MSIERQIVIFNLASTCFSIHASITARVGDFKRPISRALGRVRVREYLVKMSKLEVS